MAIPLIPAAIAGGSKLLAALRGAKVLGSVVNAAKGLGTAANAVKGAKATRMAGDALRGTGKFLMDSAGGSKSLMAQRLAPDVAFGVLGGVMTPGDLGDKVIAGTTQAVGGGLGGLAAAGAARKLGAGEGIQTLVDFGGSMVGDQFGYAAGDALMRAKGGGTTPYEKMSIEQEEMLRQQIEAEMAQKYGMGGDPFLMQNGLG